MPIRAEFVDRLLEIQRKFKNKKELMRFLIQYIFVYLPSESHTTLFFLQQIVTGRKKFLYQADCRHIKVPIRPELSVANIWYDAIRIPGVLEYFPDEWQGCRRVDRKFFWMILTTLHEEYVQHLIRGSREMRARHQAEMVVPRNLLQPNDDWVDNLLRDEGFVPIPGRRTGPSLLVQRQMRQRRPRAQPPTFDHGVNVEQYIEALDYREAQSLAQQEADNQSVQVVIPANLNRPPLEVQPTQVQSELGDQPAMENLGTGLVPNNLDLQSNAESFRTVTGQQFPNRPSNVSMIGPLRQQRGDDFQSANGGSNGN